MVVIRPLALVVLMLGLALPASAAGATTRIIVKHDPGLSRGEQRDIRKDAGVRLVDTLELPRTEVVAATAANAGDALRELNADDDVVYAEPDRTRTVLEVGPDPYRTWMWGLNNTGAMTMPGHAQPGLDDADIDASEAWLRHDGQGVPITGAGVTVAVVDSGVDDQHEDLTGQVVDQYDFINDTATAADMTGHGTAVTGIIAARR